MREWPPLCHISYMHNLSMGVNSISIQRSASPPYSNMELVGSLLTPFSFRIRTCIQQMRGTRAGELAFYDFDDGRLTRLIPVFCIRCYYRNNFFFILSLNCFRLSLKNAVAYSSYINEGTMSLIYENPHRYAMNSQGNANRVIPSTFVDGRELIRDCCERVRKLTRPLYSSTMLNKPR